MRKAKTNEKVTTPAPDVLTKVVPAPTDGWDAISPLASMDPKRAPILNNWMPRPGYVELRQGTWPWTILQGTDVPVETLMVRRTGSGEQFFAAMGGTIYNVTTQGAVTAALTSLNSARWQYTNFTPALGTTVIQCVNGVDTLKQYDGSSWTTPSITGLPGGRTTASFTNIHAQKRRLWYVIGGTTIAAYMPVDAISGAITGTLDLGAGWSKGGSLLAITGWTVDGGNGPQDYVCFVSTRGQITIYSGSDPAVAASWTIVGTFDISPPIGARCCYRVGSDVAIITQQGVIPISQALPFDPSADRSVALTARIQNAMAQAASNGLNMFGWQLIAFAPETALILNVPQVEGQQQVQYVTNTLTGAWTQFTGWNANCFEVFNNTLYFGGNDSTVYQAFTGSTDFATSIIADMQCAYNYFDNPGRVKRMTMIQPFITAAQTIYPTLSVDTDFNTSSQTSAVTILNGGSMWDQALWDNGVWFGALIQTTAWLSAEAIGHALAIHMTVNVASSSGVGNQAIFDACFFDAATFDTTIDRLPIILQVNAFNTLLELGAIV